jgi:hypothetical protein
MSTIMQGLEMGTSAVKSFRGGYRLFNLSSVASADLVPEFAGLRGSLSA